MRLSIANFLLNLITFSIYRFWAKTRVRRHIWSSIRINGEPLEYTGTGGELFRGALAVFLALNWDGTIDINRIAQSQAPVDKRGEGLADAFDIDVF